jgi:ABC-2 type transport system ATP-binding protein
MISFESVAFAYRASEPVFERLALEIGPGLTLVLGVNGSGKSTLLKLAAGVERPDTGTVTVGGFDLWTDEIAARRGLAYVPEFPDLTPYATIREICDYVARLRREPAAAGREALERVGLGPYAHRSVRELSMGQKRRATFAAAWIGTPSHILLDEPLEALDRKVREAALDWIFGLAAAGSTVVVVSHEIEPFAARAERAVGLVLGRPAAVVPLPSDAAARAGLLESLARGD